MRFLLGISLALASPAFHLAHACQFHSTRNIQYDPEFIASAIAESDSFRAERRSSSNATRKIAIQNVRVFDGHRLLPLSTVVIDGDVIGEDADGAELVDGEGGVLLPGLIDTHTHPANITDLQELSRYGITTTMVMACFQPQLCTALRNLPSLSDVLIGSLPASAPGSVHGNIVLAVDQNGDRLVYNSSMAPGWIEEETAWGPDFVKIIAEDPGLDQETLDALVKASHKGGVRVACHAATYDAYQQATNSRVDHIQHSPLDKPADIHMVRNIACHGQTVTPTLSIMRAIADANTTSIYAAAQETVRRLHKANVPILAGTDANMQQGLIATVPFGSSIHEELELLVEAGLSPVAALQAATSLPAKRWGLVDRGVIAPGKRADLLLVSGDPTVDIKDTRNIKKIWFAGEEFKGPLGQV